MCEMRGWLNGLIDGTCDIDEVDELISKKITEAVKRGYKYGYIDGRIKRIEKPRSELLRAVKSVDLTPLGTSIRGELFGQLRGANKEG